LSKILFTIFSPYPFNLSQKKEKESFKFDLIFFNQEMNKTFLIALIAIICIVIGERDYKGEFRAWTKKHSKVLFFFFLFVFI
jgi:hypothetical protein